MLFTVLPIYLVDALNGQESTAFLASAYSAGFMVGCIFGPKLIFEFGHIRAFAAAASAFSITLLAYTVSINIPVWVALRIINGVALAVMFSATDSWINSNTAKENRGQVLATYAIVLSLISISSQYLVYAFDDKRQLLALVLCVFISLAIIMLATTRYTPTPLQAVRPMKLSAYAKQNKTAFFGCLVSGALTTSALTIFPHQLSESGFSNSMVGISIGSLYFGRLILQWPIGRLSDRIDRRWILLSSSILSGFFALTFLIFILGKSTGLALGLPLEWLTVIFLGLWGGLSMPIYSLSVALALDHSSKDEIVSVTSSSLLLYALGGIFGPLICAVSTMLLGTWSLPAVLAIMAFCYSLFAISRIKNSKRPKTEGSIGYANLPTTSLMIGER